MIHKLDLHYTYIISIVKTIVVVVSEKFSQEHNTKPHLKQIEREKEKIKKQNSFKAICFT